MDKFLEILKKYWGFSEFRSVQGQIIQSVSDGKDTLGLMPTAGGKSITFQVPALASEGICIVITPLIALMNDQIAILKKKEIKAVAIHSGLSKHETTMLIDNAVYGAYKLLYISPERLGSYYFIEKLKQMQVSLLAIDEAHCISQWGYDFRPSYLNIAKVREYLPGVPVLALTATATPDVITDIQKKLHFPEENVIQTDFSRPNLIYYVRYSTSKIADLVKVCKSIKGTGIVYVRNRRKTREVSELLNQQGVSADFYHAGLRQEIRKNKQIDWTSGKVRVIVATNAFGMGIDKPDVRFVAHLDIPDSPEAYFQEAGRAGRDGKKSFAVMIAGSKDKGQALTRIAVNFPEIEYIKRVYQALGNYLQIPIGGGKGLAYEFQLYDFARTFKFQALTAFNAIKLLQNQGYLELTDEMNNPSRLHFIMGRDDLYKFQVKNFKFDGFIKLVLRSYTGLFSDYTVIDEDLLAKRASIPRDLVYQYLIKLSQQKVVNYIPAKRTPLLYYMEERLDDKTLYISAENFRDRRDRFTTRLNSMIDYIYGEDKCRSVFLLEYFGQKNSKDCGLCDVCKSKEQEMLIDEQYHDIVEKVLSGIESGSVTAKDLLGKLDCNEYEFNAVVRELLDEEKIRYNEAGEIEKAK